MNKIKQSAIEVIINEAAALFLKNGIASVSMADIAKEVGIGEATLYRYFGKKQNIIYQVTIKLWKEVYSYFISKSKTENGYERIKLLYDSYLDYFIKHQEFFRFINEFDNLTSIDDLYQNEYDNTLMLFENYFIDSYKLALDEGSINEIDDPKLFYHSTILALFNLCKKLSSISLTRLDDEFKKEEEIQVLIDIIMYRLKK